MWTWFLVRVGLRVSSRVRLRVPVRVPLRVPFRGVPVKGCLEGSYARICIRALEGVCDF